MQFSTLINCYALFAATGLAGYTLQDDYFADGFFDQFTFWDTVDPTDGFVDYQSYSDASSANLISNTSSNAKMMVDSTNETPDGRPSVRLTSTKSYSSGLIVIDIEHMPGGICGTWPAFWMVGPDWPDGGEIDIFEGVNEQTVNDMTLHTGPGCSISNNGDFSGSITYTSCVSSSEDDDGCQIVASDSNTYGAGFNAIGGGVYATEWTSGYIAIYFFPRGSVPSDVLGDSPDPLGWGTPLANFSGDCDMATAFTDQQLVFDTTFCGDWAGDVWSSGSCASSATTCDAFVQDNPSAFVDAYWSINALKVYQTDDDDDDDDDLAAESTYVATSTSMVYVTQATSASTTSTVPAATSTVPAATTFAVSTTSSGYAPDVGSSGIVDDDSEADATTTDAAPTGFEWSNTPDGEASYSGDRRDVGEDEDEEVKERHARHLKMHNRHSGRRL